MLNQTNSSNFSKLNILSRLVCYQIDDLFEKLEVDVRLTGHPMYIGCCPIHQGNNYSALNLYPEGETVPGYWRCNTRHCERIFKNTIIGFARGVLSRKYYGWTSNSKQEDNMAPFDKVIKWLCKLVDKDWNDIKVDAKTEEIHKFASQIASFKEISAKNTGTPREDIRSHLEIPSPYYIARGYRPETLDYFDVGLCNNPNKENFGRTIVPVYNEDGKYMVGCSARSQYNRCDSCRLFHSSTERCPDTCNRKMFEKWLHTGNVASYLYNWWNARKNIRDTGTAVLVEGPGDVWRLFEGGITNAVAMLGADLSEEQEILLERSGVTRIAVIRDNDAAGEMCVEALKRKLGRFYKLKFILPSAKDVGELTIEQVKQEIVPCL
jgi:5S rRNA maturation endonuclease (ribonuclease M5)